MDTRTPPSAPQPFAVKVTKVSGTVVVYGTYVNRETALAVAAALERAGAKGVWVEPGGTR